MNTLVIYNLFRFLFLHNIIGPLDIMWKPLSTTVNATLTFYWLRKKKKQQQQPGIKGNLFYLLYTFSVLGVSRALCPNVFAVVMATVAAVKTTNVTDAGCRRRGGGERRAAMIVTGGTGGGGVRFIGLAARVFTVETRLHF